MNDLALFFYPHSWKELVHCFIIAIPPGFLVGTLASVCVMHGWMNFGAEMTRFADREFYSVRKCMHTHFR